MERTIISSIGGLLLVCSAQAQNIVGYEYWFDQNHAARIYVPVAPNTTVNLQNAQLNTTGLSLGQHQACLRWKDQPAVGQSRWSSVVCRTLQLGQPGPWEIIAVRYWVGTPANDSDPLIRTKYFDTPQTTLTYIGLLDLCGYPTAPPQTLKLQLLDNHGQWSSVVTRSVTINAAGSLGAPSITASATTFCPGQVVTFTATPQTGSGFATPTGYNWQIPSGNGWSAQPSNGNTIVVTIGSTTGSVQAAATNFCGTGPLGGMTVTLPAAPDQVAFINGPLQACVGSNVTYSVPATPPGITFNWSIAGNGWSPTSGTGPSIPVVVGSTDATITVVAQNVCGVQAPPRTAQITVTAPPDAGSNGTLAICSDADSVNLFTYLQGTPGAGGVWRLNGVVVSSTYNPAINSPGVYTYTVSGSGPCADATASVTVTEPQAPDAGADATIAWCSNAGTQIMVSNLGGTPDGGGTWTGPSATGGVFNPATMLGGVYTYTVNGTAPCSSASATLNISVQQAPNAGTGGTLELCAGSLPIMLTDALGSGVALNGSWNGPDGPFAGIFTPGSNTEGSYTYTVQGTGACADANSTLNVNVMQLQLTGINGPSWVPVVETLLYTATPLLIDAESIVWILPPGWTWAMADTDTLDATAFLVPPAQADTFTICAQAFGGGCTGDTVCFESIVTVGVEEISDGGFGLIIFPNPNDGRFTVRMPSASEPMLVRVLDALGRVIASSVLTGERINLDLSEHPSGTYVIQWTTPTRWGASRIVVTR